MSLLLPYFGRGNEQGLTFPAFGKLKRGFGVEDGMITRNPITGGRVNRGRRWKKFKRNPYGINPGNAINITPPRPMEINTRFSGRMADLLRGERDG